MSEQRLTKLRFDILQLCHTENERGQQGISTYQSLGLKPAAKRTLWWLIDQGYVTRDAYRSFVTTPAGDTRYWQEYEER